MKKLIKIVLGLIVTLILLALAIPLFISADTLKKELIAKASEATGRKVDVAGKASLTLFPNIAVSVEDVTIGNGAGFRAPYLIHAKKLATGAALMPLLSGNLNVTGITLEGADIQLEQLASGAKNWEFTKQQVQDKAKQTADKNAAASSSPLKSFALGDISVKDSAVTYLKPGKALKADQINLTVRGADALSPLSVDGSLRYQNKTAKLNVKIDKLKDFLEVNRGSAAKLQADVPGGMLKFEGTAAMGDNIAGKGNLALSVSDATELVTWATGAKPAGKLPKTIDLKGAVSADGMKYALKSATLKVDDLVATGDLAANLSGAVPFVSGSLKFGMLDFDKLLNTAQATPSHNILDAYAAESAGWSNDPLDLSALKSVNADLHLAADALKFDKLNIGNTVLHTVINGGALTTTIEKAALYDGSVTGTINASAAQTVGADISVAGVQIEPLLKDMNGSARLRGVTSLKFNLHGSGGSERAIISTLAGNGSFDVKNGAIKGVNLAQFWREAKQGFLYSHSEAEATDFTDLSATFTVAQGVVSNSDLSMKSPALYVTGKGTINLPPRTVNYVLTPSLGASGAKSNGFNIPLDITGSMDNPTVIPDVKSIVQEQLKNPTAIKNTVNSVKQTIGNFNSPKDIGKNLGGFLKGLGGQQPAPAAPAPAH